MENKHTIGDLYQMQSLPLSAKIKMTENRIKQWVDEFGEDGVYVSFSGGKDSTVLLDIARRLFPNMKAAFVDTGLEYPEIRKFVKGFDNVDWIRPKLTFKHVIEKYGYPFISKEVSNCVYGAKMGQTYRMARLNGVLKDKRGGHSLYNCPQWKFMLSSPFEISDYCCAVMKKKPVRDYEKQTGRKPILAMLASESQKRTKGWIKTGCNAFEIKHPQSQPMAFWTEQDVLLYIRDKKLPICYVYGEIVTDDEEHGQITIADLMDSELFDFGRPTLHTTGCSRTGCMFCGYGCHLEKYPNRFERMATTHPELCGYIMRGGKFFYKIFDRKGSEINLKHCNHKQIENWCVDNSGNKNFKIKSTWKPSKDGLGYWFVLEWLNIHGNLKIGIPNREHYLSVYQTDQTRKYLEMQIDEKPCNFK